MKPVHYVHMRAQFFFFDLSELDGLKSSGRGDENSNKKKNHLSEKQKNTMASPKSYHYKLDARRSESDFRSRNLHANRAPPRK